MYENPSRVQCEDTCKSVNGMSVKVCYSHMINVWAKYNQRHVRVTTLGRRRSQLVLREVDRTGRSLGTEFQAYLAPGMVKRLLVDVNRVCSGLIVRASTAVQRMIAWRVWATGARCRSH